MKESDEQVVVENRHFPIHFFLTVFETLEKFKLYPYYK